MEYRLPKVGDKVNVIEKRNYESGKLTTGVVRRLLSNPVEVHPRGNKVELEDGTVGRMVSSVDEVGVQTQTDPGEREIKTQEIRQNRPPLSQNLPVPEKIVKPSDLPGEDDLR